MFMALGYLLGSHLATWGVLGTLFGVIFVPSGTPFVSKNWMGCQRCPKSHLPRKKVTQLGTFWVPKSPKVVSRLQRHPKTSSGICLEKMLLESAFLRSSTCLNCLRGFRNQGFHVFGKFQKMTILGSHFGTISTSELSPVDQKRGSRNCFEKWYSPRLKPDPIDKPRGSWRRRLACAFSTAKTAAWTATAAATATIAKKCCSSSVFVRSCCSNSVISRCRCSILNLKSCSNCCIYYKKLMIWHALGKGQANSTVSVYPLKYFKHFSANESNQQQDNGRLHVIPIFACQDGHSWNTCVPCTSLCLHVSS